MGYAGNYWGHAPEGTKFEYYPGALGPGDGYMVCLVCEGKVDHKDTRRGTCPHCRVSFTATEETRAATRDTQTVDAHVSLLRGLPPDILRRVIQAVQR